MEDKLENEILAMARCMAINEYPRDPRECVNYAISKLVTEETIMENCVLFDITRDEYLENLNNCLNRKYNELIKKEVCR